jgi:uncharacterized protein
MSTASVIEGARALGFDARVLGLTILPTEKCNFRCVYCYENFPNRCMSDEVAEAIKKLIFARSRDLRSLSIRWFGGGPLLEAERVIDLTSFAQSICKRKSIVFSSGATTNGYLLHFELFERLLSAGVRRFQISLDGMVKEHNSTRRINNAIGSFGIILRNLMDMRCSNESFQVVIRLHVHAENVASVCELIDLISNEFGTDQRFETIIERIKRYSSTHEIPLAVASERDLKVVNDRLAKKIGRKADTATRTQFKCCYAALPNHFVIRSNGAVQKCTVALYDERNNVGRLQRDGTFSWDGKSKISAWASGLLEGNLNSLACPWAGIKAGSIGV